MTKNKKGGSNPRTKAERVSLAISIALLAGVIGIVLALWFSSSNEPARFHVSQGVVRNETGLYYLPITVTNAGSETGAEVTVEGKLKKAGDPEIASTTFDFVPGRSSVEGILVFSQEPTAAEVYVTSYQQP
ncbi:MAG: hypothetical protein HY785_02765 [Oscillatoriophycideae cyanobacterium NC_groundwater_1537_Pr4_S-0.65um_50_18]|nr:hypothetical protein [Oscillatoriophycideae cyanobacterium NC_groundwater_1537_Pr4_S-0.65um_50_18]